MAAASLAVRVSAQIAEFQAAFKDMSKTVDKFAGDFEGIATRASAVGTFIGNIASDIAKSIARGLGSAAADAVRLSSEFSNAFIGLSSVAAAFGTDADVAKDAARRLASDGLLPVKDAAAGLKNLLAAGFSLPEATKLMNAFKDSAAFGRQGALSFGDAVRSATEGVKNGNSILVDNAGITKNLSQILKEAGFSAQDLSKASSDAGVRQALFNGILKEASAFTGDAQRATQTYTGQVSRLSTAYDTLLASIGDAVTQNAVVARAIESAGTAVINLTRFLADNQRGMGLVSDAVIAATKVMAGAVRVLGELGIAWNTLNNIQIKGSRLVVLGVKLIADAFLDLTSNMPPALLAASGMAGNFAKMATVSANAVGSMKLMNDEINQNNRDVLAWSETSERMARRIETFGTELTALKGKTIDVGGAIKATGAALGTNMADGAEKATKALKSFQALLDKFDSPHKIGLSTEVGTEVNLKLAFPSEIALYQQIQDGVTRITTGMRGVTLDIETEVKLPQITLPQTFYQQLFNTAQMGIAIGNSILGAIQGGGNVFAAAAGALGQSLTTGLSNYLLATKEAGGRAISGWLGGAIGAVLPGLGALLGPLVGKITSVLSEAFGGPSKEELLGRDVVSSFEQTLAGTLTAAQKLSTGNETWKNTTIAVRDAYLKAGFSALEAELAVKKLWESSKGGADKARLAVLEIQAVMDIAADKQKDVTNELEKTSEAAARGISAGVSIIKDILSPEEASALSKAYRIAQIEGFQGGEAAFLKEQLEFYGKLQEGDERLKTFFMGNTINAFKLLESGQSATFVRITDSLKSLDDEYNQLFKSIENEAPEEVMGIIEANTRKRMEAVAAERKAAENELQTITNAMEIAFREVADASVLTAEAIAQAYRDLLAGLDIKTAGGRTSFTHEPDVQIPVPVGAGVGAEGAPDKATLDALKSIDARLARMPEAITRGTRDAVLLRG